jgi:glycosidase
MEQWIDQAVIYHIYPLGCVGAPRKNDFTQSPVPRLDRLYDWLDSIQQLGGNTLYLGPVFESTAHGYDTADYFHVDRRLGTDDTLAAFSGEVHRRGMRLILDGVFNHVGRDFWAFKDVQQYQKSSRYQNWFHQLNFDQISPYGDPFSYQGWNGNYDLVKLDTQNPEVRNHLFQAVESWIRRFQMDGLRLDAADCLNFDFLSALTAFCRACKPDFWLMGEVVHGDYNRWANPPQMLDSVTNYECYKGLYSSLAEANYFEIAYALNRQFGDRGLYRNLHLYNFVDNHDVNRVASMLRNPRHLYPLYLLLFTMPGIPSIYYGSEWGILGCREAGSDAALRPALEINKLPASSPHPDLPAAIRRFSAIRAQLPALRSGDYRQLSVSHRQFAFSRHYEHQRVIVALNSDEQPQSVDLPLPSSIHSTWKDWLNPGEEFQSENGTLTFTIPACWGRILVSETDKS